MSHTLAVAVVLLQLSLILDPAAAGSPSDLDIPPGAVFEDELRVEVLDVYVNVVDGDGEPVTGLGRDAFRVVIDGDEVEVTNFVEVTPDGVEAGVPAGASNTGTADEAVPGPAESVDSTPPPSHLALVVDNPTLGQRNRRRVLRDLARWVEDGLPDETRVMVVSVRSRVRVVQPFTTDRDAVVAALEAVGDAPAGGDSARALRRLLVRDIQSADIVRIGGNQLDGGEGGPTPGGDDDGAGGGRTLPSANPKSGAQVDTTYALQKGHSLLNQVVMVRQQEHQRTLHALAGIDTVVRGMAGLAGRKSVVWVGQDLTPWPALDVYRTYYAKFESLERQLGLLRPPLWARELDLVDELEHLAGSAQAYGTVLHVLDASDRDRDLAAADFQAADNLSFVLSDTAGPELTGGPDVIGTRQLEEGGRLLAGETGGAFFGSNRNVSGFLERLEALLGTYYSLGVRSHGDADGELRSVRVTVDGPWTVRAHRRAASFSPHHRLADRARSELQLGIGDDPLGIGIEPAGEEPAEDGASVLTVRLTLPTDVVVLVPADRTHLTAELAVALIVGDERGDPSPPKVLRMTLPVPADGVGTGRRLATELRLRVAPDGRRLAVAVLDERSGVAGSTAVPLRKSVAGGPGSPSADQVSGGGRLDHHDTT